jgi:hypothetical protein
MAAFFSKGGRIESDMEQLVDQTLLRSDQAGFERDELSLQKLIEKGDLFDVSECCIQQ